MKKRKINRKLGIILTFIGNILILIALIILTIYMYYEHKTRKEINNITPLVEDIIQKNNNINNFSDYYYNLDINMPSTTIDKKNYIGLLYIDSLNIKVPILESWNRKNRLPSKCLGSIYSNNMAICGHNYNAHFGKLINIKIGDSVIFKDIDGNIFEYKVSEILSLKDNQVDEIINNNDDLILFTSNFIRNKRITIKCKKQKNTF